MAGPPSASSLAWRFLSRALLVFATVSLALVLLVFHYLSEQREDDIARRATTLLESTQTAIQAFESERSVVRVVNALSAGASDVIHLVVIRQGPSGPEAMASSENAWAGRPPSSDWPDHIWPQMKASLDSNQRTNTVKNDRYRAALPILMRSADRLRNEPGVIYVELDISKARQAAIRSLAVIGAVLVSVVAAITVSMFLALRKHVLLPIAELKDAMDQRMASGGCTPVAILAEDELGRLANSFNQLMSTVADHETRLKAIMETMADALVTVDAKETILSCNAATRLLLGWTEDDLKGQSIARILPAGVDVAKDGFAAHYRATVAASSLGRSKEIRLLHKGGHELAFELSVGMSVAGGSALYVCLLRDITERKRNDRLKGEFLATVSHELRTPLTGVRAALELLHDHFGHLAPPKAQRLMALANDNSSRLAMLINDILDLQKLESGALVMHMSVVSLSGLLHRTMELNKPYGDKFSVTIRSQADFPDLAVTADEDRLIQVMTNLLSNAAKFARTGTSVQVSLQARDGMAVIGVHDQGAGIPASFRSSIFQKFSQADGATTRKREGTGLGLHICKQLMVAMKGDIYFESEEGVGTSFFVCLPIVTEAAIEGFMQA